MQALRKQTQAARDAGQDEFASAVIEGLSKPPKALPCRYFYDAEGSELFEGITRLPEYYQTRTEAAILDQYGTDIVRDIPDGAVMVEFGSGSSLKTELLLRRLPELRAYVAIDVSPSALDDARSRLAKRFPQLDVVTIVGDFASSIDLPSGLADAPSLGFFPGSTIGNLAPADAVDLLRVFRSLLSPGRLVVGVDLKKDTRRLVSAYDDSAGITAAFNLNLLARINRELGAEFDLSTFRHRAVYNSGEGRIEMHLESTRSQDVEVCGRVFHFRAGETIHTENSYKYAVGEFGVLARAAGWSVEQVWTDRDNLFSVHSLLSD